MCNLISIWTMGTTADGTEWKWRETLFWVDVDPTLSVCIQRWSFWGLKLDKLTTSYSPVSFEVFQSEVAQWGVMTSSVVFDNTNILMEDELPTVSFPIDCSKSDKGDLRSVCDVSYLNPCFGRHQEIHVKKACRICGLYRRISKKWRNRAGRVARRK